MVFEFYFVAATVGAFIVSGLRHHGVSTTHTVNNSLARTDLIYVYNDLKRIVERYSDPEIEEELEKMCENLNEYERALLKERIYKFEVHAHNYKLYKDSIGYNYPRVATRDVMPKYAFSRGYGVTTESLIVTYGLIMSKIEPYDPERRTAYEWWMSYMERAMRDNYNFPILEELDPTYAPQTKLELKINAMLKKKDPERFKNLPVYEGDD